VSLQPKWGVALHGFDGIEHSEPFRPSLFKFFTFYCIEILIEKKSKDFIQTTNGA